MNESQRQRLKLMACPFLTSKERDSETGLDYFLARYYSAIQGRFTSVDPENAGVDVRSPQTWNAYAYAVGNPVKYRDPDGLSVKICDTDGKCVSISDEDAKRYTFNKEYQKNNGFYTKGDGRIYSSGGNVIGTYRNTGCDECLYSTAALEIGRYVDPIPKATLAFAATGALVGAGGGVILYAAQPFIVTVTTLGSETAPEAAPAALDGVSPATVRAFERQLEQHGRGALEKSLRSLEKQLANHLTKIEEARKAGGFTSSMEREVLIFEKSIQAIKQILARKP